MKDKSNPTIADSVSTKTQLTDAEYAELVNAYAVYHTTFFEYPQPLCQYCKMEESCCICSNYDAEGNEL